MGRPLRAAQGGLIYHALNRANARMKIFEEDEDHAAFEAVLGEAVERFSLRLLAYCLMPNHWRLVLWPRDDGDLSRFTGWVARVNQALTENELQAVHRSIDRGGPARTARAIKELGLETTVRPRGRPRTNKSS